MALLRRKREQRSMVAAARRMVVDPPKGVPVKVATPRQEWQDDAWDYYDAVPEVGHAVRYVGNAMAKLRLFPAVADPDDPDAPPISITDERVACPPSVIAAARAELARLRSKRGGQAEIWKQLAHNLEVAGEGYLVGRAERTVESTVEGVDPMTFPEEWEVHSISEVTSEHGRYMIKASPSDKGTALGPEDTCIRVWQRHPRWAEQPDCALSKLLVECEALHTLALLVIGESNSKRNNGFFLVPNGITFQSANATDADGNDETDPDADPVMTALAQTMQGPIADPASPSAVQPTLLRGPKDELEGVRHVLATRTADSIDEKIEGRVKRLARGLDLPVEVVMGLESTTFANAAQVDQDTFDDYLQPRAELLCDALTYGYYTPQLSENPDVPPEWAERIVLWYDPSRLISQPDPAEHAKDAHGALVISDAALRKAYRFDPDDAPDEEELLRRTGLQRGIMTGDLTLALLKMLGIPIEIAVPAEVPVVDGAPAPVEDQATASRRRADDLLATIGTPSRPNPRTPAEMLARLHEAGATPEDIAALYELAMSSGPPALLAAARPARARNNYGARLLAIDVQLRTKLTVASDAAMGRALERAGNRLRTKAPKLGVDKQLLLHVPARNVAATLGQAIVGSASEDLLEGAWDELEGQFRTWAAAAQAEALDLAARISSGFSVAQRDAAMLRQAADLDEAWLWMRSALEGLAQARLFDPSPGAPDLGEFDPSVSIPAGLVRQAMARAGGATGLVTSGRDAWVAVYPDGAPAGMIGTGETISGVLADGGASIEGYQWIYGPGSRKTPFDPHLQLDGTEFVNFDDPVLANTSGWPDDAFYFPGDHAGCQCDYEPTIITPAEA